MSKEKILSISVAAYNIEKLITDNLNSFINSEVNDLIEIIVTDDGSTDNTSNIVEEYVKKYPETIRLIKQPNMGAGSTVNSGLRHATGKYFKMIDGDDWVDTSVLNKIVKELKEIDVDMVITNYDLFDEKNKKIIKTNKINIEPNKILEFSTFCRNTKLEMHNVMYKTNILKENNIVLDNGFYTDVEYLLLPVNKIKKCIFFDNSLYIYRIARAGQSVSLESMQKHIDMHDLVLKRLINYYETNKKYLNEETKEYITNRLGGMADTQLMVILSFGNNRDSVKKFFKEIEELSIDIYKKFIRGKKEKILLYSNFLLINTTTQIIRRKFRS